VIGGSRVWGIVGLGMTSPSKNHTGPPGMQPETECHRPASSSRYEKEQQTTEISITEKQVRAYEKIPAKKTEKGIFPKRPEKRYEKRKESDY